MILCVFAMIAITHFFNSYVNADISVGIQAPEGMAYTFKDSIDIGGKRYLVGFERIIQTGEINGLLIGIDLTSQDEILYFSYDINYDEVFEYIGFFDDFSFGVVSRNTSVFSHYVYRQFENTQILKFDLDGFFLDKCTLYSDFIGYGNAGHQIFLQSESNQLTRVNGELEITTIDSEPIISYEPFEFQFRGLAWLNYASVDKILIESPGYYHVEIEDYHFHYEFDLLIEPNIEGIHDQQMTHEPVMIFCGGDLTINGDPYEKGSLITVPGSYELEIYGVMYYYTKIQFTILPVTTGIENGDITKDIVRIFSNAVDLELNGDRYTGEAISNPGEYRLSIFGINGYLETMEFTILPSVAGVENMGVYENEVMIFCNGEAYLNGKLMDQEVKVNKPGVYWIEIKYNGITVEELSFSIVEVLDETHPDVVERDTGNGYYYVLGAIILIGVFLIIRKK